MKSIFLLAILWAAIPAFSQQTFLVRITDQYTGQILPAASIQCKECQTTVQTNAAGESLFTQNQPELHLIVSYAGYELRPVVVRPSAFYQHWEN